MERNKANAPLHSKEQSLNLGQPPDNGGEGSSPRIMNQDLELVEPL